MKELLPNRFAASIEKLNYNTINEIRLRVNQPTLIHYGGWRYLGPSGISNTKSETLSPSFSEIQDIVYKACECSVFAHNDDLIRGFVTYKGVRIGVCGDVVAESGKVTTVKNFSSLVIRFPHAVKDCSLAALPYLVVEGEVLNTLVISPPACGKTTFIRDFTRVITTRHIVGNVLVIDERGEICACKNGSPTLDIGENVDIISGANKVWGITTGVRSLAPSVIVLDEIMTQQDCEALHYAMGCGVGVIATMHARDWQDLTKKFDFYSVLEKIFERVVILSNRLGIGTLESILDISGKCLWIGSEV